jgi:hypothetical protein
MGKGLDHYIGIVEQSHMDKTASAKPAQINQALLSKIANELVGTERGVVTGAPGQVLAANDGADAALALAGLSAEQVAALEAAKPAPKAGQPVVSDADGKVTNALQMNKDPIAVAEAAGDTAKVAELRRAQEIGDVMATSFQEGLEKQAFDREYREALDFLQSRGVLENYDIVA